MFVAATKFQHLKNNLENFFKKKIFFSAFLVSKILRNIIIII
jgi:small basic protein